jgi:hypothetical protein
VTLIPRPSKPANLSLTELIERGQRCAAWRSENPWPRRDPTTPELRWLRDPGAACTRQLSRAQIRDLVGSAMHTRDGIRKNRVECAKLIAAIKLLITRFENGEITLTAAWMAQPDPLVERFERGWHRTRGPPDDIPINDQRPAVGSSGARGAAKRAQVFDETAHHNPAGITPHVINAVRRTILLARMAEQFLSESRWVAENLSLDEAEAFWRQAGSPLATPPDTDPSAPRPATARRRRRMCKSNRKRHHHHRREGEEQ